ncbi:hypothetical protein T09_4566 [Trichinella sp. T9]|nr:hypothetical protein T09_4566 [Trichinella sp. T9]
MLLCQKMNITSENTLHILLLLFLCKIQDLLKAEFFVLDEKIVTAMSPSRSFTDDAFVLNAILGLSDGIYERHEFAKRERSFNEAFHDLDIPTTGVVRAS